MDIEIAYQQALDYLYSFIDYSLTRNLRNLPDKFNLDRMSRLMEFLGNPHMQYPVIHVAGTKGKGSTSAMCASILQAAGYVAGFYTSPHLQDYAERIQINGVPIDHEELVDLVKEIKPAVTEVPDLTTFELTTALAFLHFARRKVDCAVIEVGLGGRLDATNIVSPVVSVITSISYDHMAVLGNTLSAIAGEKGGIIKEGKPVVLAPQKDEARRVLVSLAKERGASVIQVGEDILFAPWTHSMDGQSLLLWKADEQPLVDEFIESGGRTTWAPLRVQIPLLGYHQVENAATAYAAITVIRNHGMVIDDEAIRNGFEKVNWAGRFEILNRYPPVVVDSAHNRDSALKLRHAVDDYFPGVPVILIFGASEDKDIEGMFAELLPRCKQVITTQSDHPRACNPEELVHLAHKHGKPARVIVPIEKAIETALNIAGQEAIVLVTGSLFVAAAARHIWLKTFQQANSIPGGIVRILR